MDRSSLQSTAELIKVVAVSVFFQNATRNSYFGLFPFAGYVCKPLSFHKRFSNAIRDQIFPQ
jgi:hypothetical protein